METGKEIQRYSMQFRTVSLAPVKPDPGTFRRWLDHFKEFISITKDCLEVLLKVSPIAFFPPAMMLWSYLHGIGWSEIFLDSVGSIPGLVTLLAAAVLLLFALFLQFCLPSLLLMPAASQLETSEEREKIEMKHLAILNLLPALSWTVVFATVIWRWPDAGYFAILGACLAALAVALFAAFVMRKRFLPEDTAGFKNTVLRLLSVAAFPVVGAVASSSSLVAAIWVVEYQPFSSSSPFIVLCVCCIMSLVGLFPGLIYLDSQASKQSMSKTMVNTTAAAVGVGYFIVSSALFFAPVSSVALRMAGAYELNPKVYQVLKPDLVYAMQAAHLPVYEVKQGAKTNEPRVFFVGAFLRFNFGGLKLLCAAPYNPNAVAQQASNGTTGEDAVSSSKATTTTNANAEEAKRRLRAGNWCLPVKADDIKPIHRHFAG